MKTFKLIGMVLLAVMMCMNFTACSKSGNEEEPPAPSKQPIEEFTQGNMSFTEKAGEQTFSFTANEAWAINVAATSGQHSWCTVSPARGNAGSQVVKVVVQENDTYDDRSVTITLRSGNEDKTFVVTQKQKNAILLTSDKFEIEQKGGEFTVEVKANVNYTATIGETCKSWITESKNTRTLSTATKTYSVAANEDSEKREGTITFTDGTLSETVYIYQAGGDIILLSKNEYNIDAAGEDITVELKSNCEYEVEMPKVNWIHEISTRAMSSHTLRYTIDANTTYDSREAKISYRNKNRDIVETLTIVQAQKDAIILSKKEVIVKAEGETIEVKLSANVEYEVEMPNVDWITATTTRGLTEHTLYYTITKNESYDNRSAIINFKNMSNEMVETLNIYQVENVAILLSQKEYSVSSTGETITVDVNSNIGFEILMPEVDWIAAVPSSRGLSSCSLKFAIRANEEYENRSANIVFYNKEHNVSETVRITQAQKNIIISNNTNYTVTADGGILAIEITSNVNYEVLMPDVNWIEQVTTRSLNNRTLTLRIKENTSKESREATLTLYYQSDTTLNVPITIIQTGSVNSCGNIDDLNNKEW